MSQYRQNDRSSQFRQSSQRRRMAQLEYREELERQEERKYREQQRRRREQQAQARQAQQEEQARRARQAQARQTRQAQQPMQQPVQQQPVQQQTVQQPIQQQPVQQQTLQQPYQQPVQQVRAQQPRRTGSENRKTAVSAKQTRHGGNAAKRSAKSGGKTSVLDNLGTAGVVAKNLLRVYRKQKWTISELLFFPLVLIYLEALLRLYGGTGLFSHFLYPLVFNISAGLLVSAVGAVLPKRWRRTVFMVLTYLTCLVFVVSCMVHDNYQVYMSIGSILAGTHNVVSEYSGEMFAAIFKGIPKIILFFVPGLFYSVTGRRRVPLRRYQPVFAGIIAAFALVLFGVGVFAGSHGSSATTYSGVQDFNSSTKMFGLVTAIRLSGGGSSTSSDFVIDEPAPEAGQEEVLLQEASVEEESEPIVYGKNEMDIDLDSLIESGDETIASISTYVKSLTPSSQNAYTGLFEGKNLIMISAEAFSDKAVSQELTPTLYRLIHNGIYMSEFYQPAWGGSTSTGEYSLLMGLAPTRGVQSVTDSANINNYFTMGNQLQRLNYYSAAFHSGSYSVYSRDKTHENLGYSVWRGNGNGLEELIGTDTSDSVLFETTLDACMDQQPFSIYYMTLSGHCTYLKSSRFVTKYYDQVKAYYGDTYSETVLYYICYQMELESALTIMLEKLDAAGILDDTVICMCTDHYPYGLEQADAFATDRDYLLELYGEDYKDFSWNRDRNSAVIWSGCLENEYKDMACEISDPTYSLDLVPTLSNLFGVEYDSRMLTGRDILSDAEAIALWNNYSWVTRYGKYDSYSKTFYANPGYESYANDEDYVSRINQIVANKLKFADAVIVNDYFGVLFGEDNEVGQVMTVEPKTEEEETETAATDGEAAGAAETEPVDTEPEATA